LYRNRKSRYETDTKVNESFNNRKRKEKKFQIYFFRKFVKLSFHFINFTFKLLLMEEHNTSTVERRKIILDLINEKGQVMVLELSKRFSVSEVTIRNDLDQLEKKKVLIRTRGGAMKMETLVTVDHRLSDKDKLHAAEKVKIGKYAASLIEDNSTVIIDSGTTTNEIVRNLPSNKEITVITNAINIVNQLIAQNYSNVNVILLGGYLRKTSHSLVGPLAEKNLSNFYVDKVFLGVDGFDIKQGAYTPNIEEAHLNQQMIDVAREVILVADSSKFGRKSLAFICETSRINKVITDDGILDEDQRRLEDAGVKVIVVK
jgi:DeoR family transcriptional regulator, aga operon transcriptional repressor